MLIDRDLTQKISKDYLTYYLTTPYTFKSNRERKCNKLIKSLLQADTKLIFSRN